MTELDPELGPALPLLVFLFVKVQKSYLVQFVKVLKSYLVQKSSQI